MRAMVLPASQRTGKREAGSVEVPVRASGALLALAVSLVHVADQGGLTALNRPPWMGWGFRLIEAGGVLTALVMISPWPARPWPGGPPLARLRWLAGVLLGVAPFCAYLLTRTVGLPGDPGDVGNWGYWGTVALFAEAALVMLSVGMLARTARRQ